MIFDNITRRCGHEEQIGFAGSFGDMTGISDERAAIMTDQYDKSVERAINKAKRKLCHSCLKQLSEEAIRKELDESSTGEAYRERQLKLLDGVHWR